ncbi:MAG: protein translocase subunit SecF [Rhodospirillales bacterium]|nr:protein translocase subunit SecF [Rhodospirillales bacterium]
MWRGIVLFPTVPKVPFIGMRMFSFTVSVVMVLLSLTVVSVKGFNLGIDFRGGIIVEVRTQGPANMSQMRETLGGLGLGEVALQGFGTPSDVLIRIQEQEGGEKAQQEAVEKIRAALGPTVEYRRIEAVGPLVSNELFWNGMWAVGLGVLGILVYIWFRFEWQFGASGVLALAHDVISTIGLYSLLDVEFNLTSVAALLTIAGYSINDTVVIFDRVRDNLRKYKTMPLGDLLNLSNNQTLSRTVMTGGTTILALLGLYFLGGDVLSGFSLAMLFGVVCGTYSSVFVAVPLLMYLRPPQRNPTATKPVPGAEAAE